MKFKLIIIFLILASLNLASQEVILRKFDDGRNYYLYKNYAKNTVDTLMGIGERAVISDFLVFDDNNVIVIENNYIGFFYYHFIRINNQWRMRYNTSLQTHKRFMTDEEMKIHMSNFKIEDLELISFDQNGERVNFDLSPYYKKNDARRKRIEAKYNTKKE